MPHVLTPRVGLPRLGLIAVAALTLLACKPEEVAPAAADAAQPPASTVPAAPSAPPAAAPAPAQTPSPTPSSPPRQSREPQASIPEGPDMAPERIPAGETPCRAEIGQAAATRLAERCRMVSPATHPPCHVDNPCGLIRSEIDRACGQYGPGEAKPAECAG